MTQKEKQIVNKATRIAFDEYRYIFTTTGPRTIKIARCCLHSSLIEIEDSAFVIASKSIDCDKLFHQVTSQIKEKIEELMLCLAPAKKGKISVHTSLPGVKKALDIYYFNKKEKVYKFQ